MSTTSLSSCDNYDCYPYSYVLEDSYATHMHSCQGPFYNSLGQPLVYYAEVQPYGRRSTKGRRKEGKNCFAKAFRWYTQEREPECCHRVSPELSGFATWLDAKYGEYLRENNGQLYCPAQRPPSTQNTGPCAPCAPCQPNEPSTTKRYSRMRSPWRKFRCHNKNAGDVPCRTPNGSCQFILQPKDLTRPASECYYQTPATCPNKSNTTVISTELEGVKRTIVKSQSLTSICHEKINTTCIDMITTQEGPKVKQVDAQKVRVAPQMPRTSPCDQSCKVKQEAKSVTKIQSTTAKVQKTGKPCDTNSCREECKPVKEIHTPAKEQKNVVPCDLNCNQGRKQLPAKVQNIDIPCDPNCCKEGCKPVAETRASSKSQNKEGPYEPSCCNPECSSVEPNRAPAQSQKTEIPYDPKRCYPKYERVQEIQSSVQSRKIEIPYNPNYCNTECKPAEEIRVQVQAQNIEIAADCFRQECKSTGDTQRSLTQSKIKDVPCDPTCIYKQTTKPACDTRNITQSQNIVIPCEPSCYKPEYKPVGEIQQNYTKSQIKDVSCDPNCIYNQTYKPAGEVRNTDLSKNMTILCDPNCYKPEYKPPGLIQRGFTRSRIRDPCDPSCIYKQEYKPAEEIRPPVREQNVANPREPSCLTQANKLAADTSCDPKCLYMQSAAATPKVPVNIQNINTSCDTSCSYRQESKTTRDIRTPTKSQTMQVSCECDPNSYKFAADCSCKPIPLPKIQRSTSKSQRSETACMCYPTRSVSKVKTVPPKPEKVDRECQCPEDEILPVDAEVQCEPSRQTFTSTSTNSTLCKCIIEKSIPTPPQKPPCKPMQPAPKPPSRHFIPFISSKKAQKPAKTAEESCQCPEDDIIKFDAPSQYDCNHIDTRCDCVCPSVKPEKPRLVCNAQRTDTRQTTNYSSVAVRQVTRSLTFRNDAAQTSDHSICLEDFGHDYAFFMKIVCADKLNNDCFCDNLTR